MFKNLSLQKKLVASFLFVASFLILVGSITNTEVGRTVSLYKGVVDDNIGNLRDLQEMQTAQLRMAVDVSTLVGGDTTAAQGESMGKDMEENVKEVLEAAKHYDAQSFEPGEAELWSALYKESWPSFLAMSREMVSLSKTGNKQDFRKRDEMADKKYQPLRLKLREAFQKINEFQARSVEKREGEAVNATQRMNWIIWALIAAGFSLAAAIGVLFSRNLASTLSQIASSLGNGAEEVASASKQISDAGSELSASATQQAAALQETVASVDEISAMVSKNADNAAKSQDVSSRSQETATKGKQAVAEMIESMNDIDRSNADIMSQIESSNREIAEIVKVIAEIGNKTKVINDIVFQTKLLSFNASVEAARAGEHGKGFAVVAEEVGNLAQMSGNAAKEISQMLEGSIQKVERIVGETKTKVERLVTVGKEKVEAGSNTAKRCGDVLDEIVANVTEVNQLITEITTASREQSQGVQEITKAMAQLDQVTQQNASASQQSADAAESLTAQAVDLRGLVQNLIGTVQGGKAAAMPMIQEAPVRAAPVKAKGKKAAAAKQAPSAAKTTDAIPDENDPRFEAA